MIVPIRTTQRMLTLSRSATNVTTARRIPVRSHETFMAKRYSVTKGRIIQPLLFLYGHFADVSYHGRSTERNGPQPQKGKKKPRQAWNIHGDELFLPGKPKGHGTMGASHIKIFQILQILLVGHRHGHPHGVHRRESLTANASGAGRSSIKEIRLTLFRFGQTRAYFCIRPDVQGLTLDLMWSQGLPPFVVLPPGVFGLQSLNREGGQLRFPSVIFLGLIPTPKTSARARPHFSRLSIGIS